MPPKTTKLKHTRNTALLERLSRIELHRAQQKAALWACPIIPDSEIPLVLNLPPSTWSLRKKSAGAPAMFSIGKRVYCRREELLAWCEGLTFVPRRHHVFAYPGAARQEAREINT